MTIIRWAMLLALLTLPQLGNAQTATQITAPGGWAPMNAPCIRQSNGSCVPVSADNPLPVTGSVAGGGGTVTAQGTDGTTARTLRTDTRGGLVPAQGAAATTRTTLTASTVATLSAASANRTGLTVQLETALTANLYLCTTQAASCSATSYDALIPSGAGVGTTYTFLFAPTTALSVFSTSTPTVVANSWTAP